MFLIFELLIILLKNIIIFLKIKIKININNFIKKSITYLLKKEKRKNEWLLNNQLFKFI